jgi:hypothetical protein
MKFQDSINQQNRTIHETKTILENINKIIEKRENYPQIRIRQESPINHAGIDFVNKSVRSSKFFVQNFCYFRNDIHKNSNDFNCHKFTNVESFRSVMNDKKIDKMEKTISFRANRKKINCIRRSICILLFDEVYSISVKSSHKIGDLRKTIGLWLDLSSLMISIKFYERILNNECHQWEAVNFGAKSFTIVFEMNPIQENEFKIINFMQEV